jgi:hypothetical protein
MDQYAPVDESELLDFSFFASDQIHPYTSATHTMLTRANTANDVSLQPLHQIAKKRIRELVHKHTHTLFSFHPDIVKADAVFEKFGQPIPVDTSLPLIEESLKKACDASGALPLLTQQLKHLFQQYKVVGEEVMRLEALLGQKTALLDKLHERQNIVMNLKNNEALPGLLEAFGLYMTEIFKEANFEATYKELVQAHKQWNFLREILSVQQLMSDKKDPTCSICLSEPVTHCVAPCGHTFCTGCVKRLTMSCYLCRGSVRERVKLFFT